MLIEVMRGLEEVPEIRLRQGECSRGQENASRGCERSKRGMRMPIEVVRVTI